MIRLMPWIASNSANKDRARREFILNLILLATILLLTISTLSAWIGEIFSSPTQRIGFEGNALAVSGIWLVFCLAYFLAQRGYARTISYLLVLIYLAGATYSTFRWGISLPEGLLIYALIIVIGGVLISARFSLILAGTISVTLLSLNALHTDHLIPVDYSWRANPPHIRDALVYSITLLIISVLSWLFNQQMEQSLARARESEAALAKERDQLEITVQRRTKELRQAQLEKLSQLYRLAEFGRLSSGLFHDLATPLNLVSLNLDEINSTALSVRRQRLTDARQALERAVEGTKKLESFLQAARRQVQNQQQTTSFGVNPEIKQVLEILEYKARRAGVKLVLQAKSNPKLKGDPLKFNQLITNLVANAIDAYDNFSSRRPEVIVTVSGKRQVKITIQDFGVGISTANMRKIFQPLFTTKASDKGTGLGLSIVKEIVHKNFDGQIEVSSKLGQGSLFTIKI